MVANVTVNTVDGQALIGYEDGSSEVVQPQSSKSFQIPEAEFATVTDIPVDPEAPRPDQGLPQPPAEKFIEAWRKVIDKIKGEIAEDIGVPEPTPHV